MNLPNITHHSTHPFSAPFSAMAEARRSQQTALLDEEQLEPWALFARKARWRGFDDP
jgi:hypothetical protein